MEASEKILLKQLASGNHLAFTTLFERYWEPFFKYVYRIVQNREDAEEVVQDFFIHLWNKRADLPELQSVSAYLYTALRNRLLNHLAKKKYRVISIEMAMEAESPLPAVGHLERKSTEKMIHAMAELLPEKMKNVYMQHQFMGLSIAEIALATGNSEQTIRNQYNSAVKKLSVVYKARLLSLVALSLFFL